MMMMMMIIIINRSLLKEFLLSYSLYHLVFGDSLCILFSPKLLRCLFDAGVAHRFSLLYSGSSFVRFRRYTQRRTTVGRTSLDEGPARHRDLYLTTLTTDKSPCPPVGFESTIPAG